jgi:hypothetical protein
LFWKKSDEFSDQDRLAGLEWKLRALEGIKTLSEGCGFGMLVF